MKTYKPELDQSKSALFQNENPNGEETFSPPHFQLQANPIQMKPVYRGMIDAGGVPELGETARTLGVRIAGKNKDLTVEKGTAIHNHEGMSTAPDNPENLAIHRRPPEWGGERK